MDIVQMTDTEKKLFKAIFPNESEIDEGKLHGYQKEALSYLRAGFAYLQEKYPSYFEKMDFTAFNSASKFHTAAKLTFFFEENDVYYAYIQKDGEEFTCSDTFYNVLIDRKYDEKIEKILEENAFSVISDTVFSNPLGTEVDENVSLEVFMEKYPEVTRQTCLYIADNGNEDIRKDIEEVIKHAKIYGVYSEYLFPSVEGVTVKDLRTKRSNPYTFNTFNI